jgi:uncharacterized secreted protein with C-terminal beta-propeller domain
MSYLLKENLRKSKYSNGGPIIYILATVADFSTEITFKQTRPFFVFTVYYPKNTIG